MVRIFGFECSDVYGDLFFFLGVLCLGLSGLIVGLCIRLSVVFKFLMLKGQYFGFLLGKFVDIV